MANVKRLVFEPAIDVKMHDGTIRNTRDFYVLQVSLKVRSKLRQMAHDAKNAEAMMMADLHAALESGCDETGKRFWSAANKEWLSEQEAGSWLDAMARQAAGMMRGPIGGKCAEQRKDADGKGITDAETGSAVLCGCELVPGEKFCPRCGSAAPSEMEIARGN